MTGCGSSYRRPRPMSAASLDPTVGSCPKGCTCRASQVRHWVRWCSLSICLGPLAKTRPTSTVPSAAWCTRTASRSSYTLCSSATRYVLTTLSVVMMSSYSTPVVVAAQPSALCSSTSRSKASSLPVLCSSLTCTAMTSATHLTALCFG